MIKYIIVVLAIAGAYYGATRYMDLDKSLVFVSQHKSASWAPRANYTIGLVYYQGDQYGKAQAAFTQLLTDYPTCQFSARALFYLEDTAEYNHDWPVARQAIDRYMEEHPEGSDAQLLRKRGELLRYQHGQ